MWLLDLPTVVQHLICRNQWNQCLWSDTHLFLFSSIHSFYCPFLTISATPPDSWWCAEHHSSGFLPLLICIKASCVAVCSFLCVGEWGALTSLAVGFRNKKHSMDNHLPRDSDLFAFCSLRSFYVGNSDLLLYRDGSLACTLQSVGVFVSLFYCLFSLVIIQCWEFLQISLPVVIQLTDYKVESFKYRKFHHIHYVNPPYNICFMLIKVLGMEMLIGVELHNKTLLNGVCLALGTTNKILLQSLYCYFIITW